MKFVILLIACICACAQAKNCNELTQATLDAKALVLQSPFTVHYSINKALVCATIIYTSAVNTSYTISSTYIQGQSVYWNQDIVFGANNTWDTHKNCETGDLTPHYFLSLPFKQDIGYCIYTCDSDGVGLADLVCPGRLTWSQTNFQQIVAAVQGVKGAPTSADTLTTCKRGTKCAYF